MLGRSTDFKVHRSRSQRRVWLFALCLWHCLDPVLCFVQIEAGNSDFQPVTRRQKKTWLETGFTDLIKPLLGC